MKTLPASLATHLLGRTRSAVLASLLLHPESALHVRELARITGTSPGSLHRELRALTELGVLLRQETGSQVHYRANPACPIFEDLAGLMRKTAGVAMMASGYRPSSNEPGHHQTMLQSLPLTLGVPNETWVILDALRRKRNAADYLGDPIESEALAECLAQATALLAATRRWLKEQHPELLQATP